MDGRQQPRRTGISFREALAFWLKLGFISFGGPAGQIAIMHSELVKRRRWISESRFLHALNYCMVLPGPEAQQLATYLGWLMHRTRGGLLAGALFVLPSLVILIVLSWIYLRFGNAPLVAGVFYGIKPAVTAIVVQAAIRIGSRALTNAWTWSIAAFAFVAIFWFHLPFPAILLVAALVGWLGGRMAPAKFLGGAGHAVGAGPGHTRAVIDDDTPTPAHARFSAKRLVRLLVAGIGLWALVLAGLVAAFGIEGTLAQMGWFFTKAALLTFGGAYAVLPYVFQSAVGDYGWVSAAQMIDGLALGETTPGPLIMIVAFVGFVGAWTQPVLGADAVLASAVAGAVTATFFTFLPSFVFIFAGGPFIESTHGRLGFTAPLAGVSAAVVGVIVNLGLFFAWHVFWPGGFALRPDWIAMAIGACAFAALTWAKRGVVTVIAGSALLGLLVSLLR